jgi:hypothetical protein
MAEKKFLIAFRPPKPLHVVASKAEIHGEHLVLTDSQGKLAALFLLEAVESCNEITLPLKPNGA